jgi:hypothetical protein
MQLLLFDTSICMHPVCLHLLVLLLLLLLLLLQCCKQSRTSLATVLYCMLMCTREGSQSPLLSLQNSGCPE